MESSKSKLYQSVKNKNSTSNTAINNSPLINSNSSLITPPINYSSPINCSNPIKTDLTQSRLPPPSNRRQIGRERIIIQERDEDLEKIRFLLSNLDVQKYRRRSTSRSSSVTLRSRPPSAEGRVPSVLHSEYRQSEFRQSEFRQSESRQGEEKDTTEENHRLESHYDSSSPFVRHSSVRGLPVRNSFIRNSFIRNSEFRSSEGRPQSCLLNRSKYDRINVTPTRDPLGSLSNKHVLIQESRDSLSKDSLSKDSLANSSRNSINLSPFRKPPIVPISQTRDTSVTRRIVQSKLSPSSTLSRSRPKSRVSSAFTHPEDSDQSTSTNPDRDQEELLIVSSIKSSIESLSKKSHLLTDQKNEIPPRLESLKLTGHQSESPNSHLSPLTIKRQLINTSPLIDTSQVINSTGSGIPKSAPTPSILHTPNFDTPKFDTPNFDKSKLHQSVNPLVPKSVTKASSLSPTIVRKNVDNLRVRTLARDRSFVQSPSPPTPTPQTPTPQTPTPQTPTPQTPTSHIHTVSPPSLQSPNPRTSTPKVPTMASSPVPRTSSNTKMDIGQSSTTEYSSIHEPDHSKVSNLFFPLSSTFLSPFLYISLSLSLHFSLLFPHFKSFFPTFRNFFYSKPKILRQLFGENSSKIP